MINIVKMPYGIKKYNKLCKFNQFPNKYGCEACGFEGKLYRHGFYYRNLITFKGAYKVVILRCKCQSCGKTYSIIPSFIIPYRQYAYEVILTSIIMMLKLGYSFSKIITLIKSLNISYSSLNTTDLSFWKNRLVSSLSSIRLFFAQYKFYNSNINSKLPIDIIKKIIIFCRLRHDFNLDYFLHMPKYFFCKL
ncbi:hypothetical protein CPAST_c15900 [Clostridium pasteurianum DSM 525 = ATCC 6013]|uniref:DUF6431 domain-containing protein n=2 Tax=Clostridium pasteurianum TaxID=1501 RepID=A0A0H3J976_CLOPA|nr:hypothetical protein CPAST_c15900 [Clostridium pasteurianum DSM 525 = ATCC 6013]AJA51653.1 hypothetical protein CLPA_c15900 [Clostridium pasteurianum DSM 525 = ATCC 6013]KRU12340.1 hypothetical protein CP6013_01587 [Clostridium pasteurianum DSM 525 = ATCC 6013]